MYLKNKEVRYVFAYFLTKTRAYTNLIYSVHKLLCASSTLFRKSSYLFTISVYSCLIELESSSLINELFWYILYELKFKSFFTTVEKYMFFLMETWQHITGISLFIFFLHTKHMCMSSRFFFRGNIPFLRVNDNRWLFHTNNTTIYTIQYVVTYFVCVFAYECACVRTCVVCCVEVFRRDIKKVITYIPLFLSYVYSLYVPP